MNKSRCMKSPLRRTGSYSPDHCARAHSARAVGTAVAAAICAMLLSSTVRAQTAPTDQKAEAASLQEVTVTGTRLQASGFDAPTPTAAVSVQDIQLRGLTNVADYLNELPAFASTDTPAARSFFTSGLATNLLNLRGLGPNRTLVLVDGQRQVASNIFGAVDINTIPQALIKRVEVVTGGASADWGSDAVAGVVNILLDDHFDGLRTSVQYGESTKHDAGSTHASIAYGGSVRDGSGHLVIAAEYQKDNGLGSQRDRALGGQGCALIPNPAFTGSSGVPHQPDRQQRRTDLPGRGRRARSRTDSGYDVRSGWNRGTAQYGSIRVGHLDRRRRRRIGGFAARTGDRAQELHGDVSPRSGTRDRVLLQGLLFPGQRVFQYYAAVCLPADDSIRQPLHSPPLSRPPWTRTD